MWTIKHRFGKFSKNIKRYRRMFRTCTFTSTILKNSIEKEFAFLKEATSKNVGNFQSSLSLQQTYSASLCSHVNNTCNKLVELQWQIQHHDPHMNSGDTIQIEVPDFYWDIDDISPNTIDQQPNNPSTQGSVTPTSKATEQQIECITPAPSHQDTDSQEIDWPDAIPVDIQPQRDLQNDQRINIQLT